MKLLESVKTMINVDISTKLDNGVSRIVIFEVNGHAIAQKNQRAAALCASVSIATLLTANSIKFLGLDNLVGIESEDGFFKITVKSIDRTIDGLLENLRYTMLALQEQHNESVSVNTHDDLLHKFNAENIMTPEEALVLVGSVPLEDPVHPHLSYPMDEIKKIQEAYKIVESALEELRFLKNQNKGD